MSKSITPLAITLGCIVAGPAIAQVSQPSSGASGASTAPLVGSTVDQSQILPNSVTSENMRAQQEVLSTSPSRRGSTLRAVAAGQADLVAGKPVSDKAGISLGTIDSVGAEGVVLATPDGKVSVPADAFGKTAKGLLLGVTKAQFALMASGAQ